MPLIIEERISLRLEEQTVLLPKEALLLHNGEKYLKLLGHNSSIVKVFAMLHGLGTPPPNASLCNSQGLINLKTMKIEAMAAALGTDEADSLFEAVDVHVKVAKAKKADLPVSVVVDVDGVDVKILCHGFHTSKSDLVVLMDSSTISAVFKYIFDQGVELGKKRVYKKPRISEPSEAAAENPTDSGSD